MGLRGSIIGSQRITGGNGFANSGTMRNQINRIVPSIAIQRAIQYPTSSTPQGYRMPNWAILYPIENGGISGKATPLFETSASIMGDGYIDGSETVVFTVSATSDLLASIEGSATVTFTALCDILGYGYIAGSADISAQPTASDIAGEFFATFIDGTYTMRDILKVLASVAVGKTTITDLGGGNATVVFRDMSDTVDRVEADMTGSERTDVTIDV